MTLQARGRTFGNRGGATANGVTVTASRFTDDGMRTTTMVVRPSAGSTLRGGTNGPRIEYGERRYRVEASLYTLGVGGAATEPEEGDQFTEVIAGTTYTFEAKPTASEPAWVPADGGRTYYRINLKRVAGEFGE